MRWVDKTAILSGRESPDRVAQVQKRPDQIDKAAARSRRKPPEVVKAYGMHVTMAIIFTGFAIPFWMAGYVYAAGIFGGLAAIILVGLVLTLLGFGQNVSKNKDTTKGI